LKYGYIIYILIGGNTMALNKPELTDQALSFLRDPSNFQWIVIPMLAFVVYVYAKAYEEKKYKQIAAGLALYMTHWFFEIINALIQKFSGHALWTVPGGTSYLLLIGVGIELSLMFAVAGLLLSKLLPEDKNVKILGINNRIFFAIANAALFSVIEIFLATTNAFHWVYPWWGSIPVFITVYIPFFLAAHFAYDMKPKNQIKFIGGLAIVNIIMLIVFAGILSWI
jgi:hypothetical protein